MDLKNVIYEKDGAIATIKLNRPKQLNALSTEVLLDVEAALNEVEADDEVRVVIVTGEGRAFAAGADIAAMKDYDQLAGFDYCATGHKVYRHMEKINKPFIAAVNGYALGGGCEMTLACDLRIASSKAVFGLPETSLGIIPGYGGTQRLPRLVNKGIAKEMSRKHLWMRLVHLQRRSLKMLQSLFLLQNMRSTMVSIWISTELLTSRML